MPAAVLLHIEQLCCEFENAWRQGGTPDLDALLAQAPADQRAKLLPELLLLELEYRRQRGEQPDVQAYARRYPEAAGWLTEVTKTRAGQRAVTETTTPQALPGYELIRELGRGGMGIVYLAQDLKLNRLVAVKILQRVPHGAEVLRRFQIEVEVIARLRHPHIVTIHETGAHNGQPYYVMEFVEGGSLSDLAKDRPMPPRRSAELVAQIADAVHYAHEQGVLHRDLKPGNILLQKNPESRIQNPEEKQTNWQLTTPIPKIADFGLAKRIGVSEDLTHSNMVMGTPGFMAPEMLVPSQRRRLSFALDVYALGSILYRLLCGAAPFEAEGATDMLVEVMLHDPIPLSRRNPALPRDLITISHCCLDREPGRRYASAAALADDLRRYLNGEPIAARPATAFERLGKWVRRRPLVASLMAAVVFSALAGVLGVTWQWRKAITALTAKEAALEHAEENLYYSLISQAQQRINAKSELEGAAEILDQCPTARRGWEWHYLQGTLNQELLRIAAHSGAVEDLAYSPDGRTLVSAGANRPDSDTIDLKVWDAHTGKPVRTLTGFADRVVNVAFSPGGKFLVAAGSQQLKVWDAATGAPLHTLDAASPIADLAFLGEALVGTAHADQIVRIWDVSAGRETSQVFGHDAPIRALAVSPGGDRLAVASAKLLKVWDVASRKPVMEITREQIWKLAFAPDGLLIVGVENKFEIFKSNTLKPVWTSSPHPGRISNLAVRPDGVSVVSLGADGALMHTDLLSRVSRYGWPVHPGRCSALSFHPHGRVLATGDGVTGVIRMLDLTKNADFYYVGKFHPLADVLPSDIQALAFAGSGESVVLARSSGLVQVCDATSGVVRKEFGIRLPRVNSAPGFTMELTSFSPGGEQLAAVSGATRRDVQLWDVAQGRKGRLLTDHPLTLWNLGFSHDGRRLVCVGVGEDPAGWARHVKVWDTQSGLSLCEIATTCKHDSKPNPASALSADGRELALADGDTSASVTIHDVQTGAAARALSGPRQPLTRLAFSPAGGWLAAADQESNIYLWSGTATEPIRAPLKGPVGALDLAFSPDGRLLAAANQQIASVWEVGSGRHLLFLKGWAATTDAGAFLPRVVWSRDGRRLAMAHPTENNSVLVWDTLATLEERQQAAERRAFLWSIEAASNCFNAPRLAKHHLEYVNSRTPPDVATTWGRAWLYSAYGHWDKAVADCVRAAGQRVPDSPQCWLLHARVLLEAGDVRAYERLRDDMLAHFGTSRKAEVIEAVVEVSGLAPSSPERALQVLALARKPGLETAAAPKRKHLIGLCLYRAGQFAEALKTCEAASLDHPEWDKRILNQLVMALSYARLGNDAAAQGNFTQLDGKLKSFGQFLKERRLPGWSASEWLELRLLDKELADLLRRPAHFSEWTPLSK